MADIARLSSIIHIVVEFENKLFLDNMDIDWHLQLEEKREECLHRHPFLDQEDTETRWRSSACATRASSTGRRRPAAIHGWIWSVIWFATVGWSTWTLTKRGTTSTGLNKKSSSSWTYVCQKNFFIFNLNNFIFKLNNIEHRVTSCCLKKLLQLKKLSMYTTTPVHYKLTMNMLRCGYLRMGRKFFETYLQVEHHHLQVEHIFVKSSWVTSNIE